MRVEIEEVERVIASQFQNSIDNKIGTQNSRGVSLLGVERVLTRDREVARIADDEMEIDVEVDGVGQEEVGEGEGEGNGDRERKGVSVAKKGEKGNEKPVTPLVIRVKERMAVVATPDADKRSHHLILVVEDSIVRTLDLHNL